MLLLKLTIVPLFIALVTLAGKRWGTRLAGILGGLPVIAGPIVVILALEQGQAFGVQAATAAMAAAAGLLSFGTAYSWLSLRMRWPAASCLSLSVWLVVSLVVSLLLSQLHFNPLAALLTAVATLLITPLLLPRVQASAVPASTLKDLPLRLLAGALLTLMITQLAQLLGSTWSGILAVFPVIGLILSVFTHRNQGGAQVTLLYRGTVRGLWSFSVFFFTLALGWQGNSFWWPLALAITNALLVQACMHLFGHVKARRIQAAAID